MSVPFFRVGNFFYINNEIIPVGTCSIDFSADDLSASIIEISTRRSIVPRQLITDYVDILQQPYTDKADLLKKTGDFFQSNKPSRDSFIVDSPLSISMRLNAGFEPLDKFGENQDIDTNTTPEDITEIGGVYNFSDTPDINKISSSNASDVGQLISLRGILSPSGNGETIGYAVTNGQNKVDIFDNPDLTGDPLSFWRVDRMENDSNQGSDLAGMLYCYVDTAITNGVPDDPTKIRALINDGNNQTLMAVYTVRPKKVGFLFRGEVGMSRLVATGAARCSYRSRRYGKLFKVKKRVDVAISGNSFYQDPRSFPDIIPALTDIRMVVESVTANDIGVFATFDMLIVDENYFDESFLIAIGQPGY